MNPANSQALPTLNPSADVKIWQPPYSLYNIKLPWYPHQQIPGITAHFEKLTVSQPVKKYPAFYGIRRLTAVTEIKNNKYNALGKDP
jgi:hypothetical protein